MENKAADLLKYAQEYSASNTDLYSLLGVGPSTSDKDIHRAWRKTGLKYHPDKAGANFDADKYELFERARDILTDVPARAAYDNARKAVLLRQAERDRVHGHRKRLIDELEAAELEAKRQKMEERDRAIELEREKARLAEEGRRRMAEEAAQFERDNLAAREAKREAAAEPDELDEKLADLQRRLDESRRRKAEKKARKKGGAVDTGDTGLADATTTKQPEATPAPPPAPAPPVSAPKWEDLKARMIAAQRRKEALAKQAEEGTNGV